jgi:hypothetical protein
MKTVDTSFGAAAAEEAELHIAVLSFTGPIDPFKTD